MLFRAVLAFDVVHTGLSWPWISFSASGTRMAYAASPRTIATFDGIEPGPSFSLPEDLSLAPFTIDKDGTTVAIATSTVIALLSATGERTRVRVADVVGDHHAVQAVAFDRSGARLWVSLENATETVLALLHGTTLAKIDVLRSPAFPRPALHELHVHIQDDAVLLLAACGEDGTFARVAGFAGGATSAVPTALDGGGLAAGLVGFSADGARVHLAEADELRTHAWPGLAELSSVPLADDFVSSFSGVVIGDHILVDGQDADSEEDAVMLFDRSAIRGTMLRDRGPKGMWAGALKPDALVTLEAKADRGHIWRAVPSKTPISN